MTGRNIVLLSDGTGNSAAKVTKTNVWRIYQAIDVSKSDHVAFYDDGVGSGGFKLLRYLGGAFGYGLARNVRELYENLCRHYRSDDDRIILFGFSRGAFTARVLSGVIGHCGVIDRGSGKTVKVWRWSKLGYEDVPVSTDEGLKKAVRIAYRLFRKKFDSAPVSNLFRGIRDSFVSGPASTDEFRKKYSATPNIAFLGVFDTVSAYGLPVDELAIAIHKWLFPLRFPDMILSCKVDHACQALALDEARQSFHPVLWTEVTFDPEGSSEVPDERPEQVWFPGVHSDVGGGYGDERLSLVPALWMLDRAKDQAGLRLRAAVVGDLRRRATALGAIHDSRSGGGALYRYKPRILEDLGCEDLDGNGHAEVHVKRFKIHQSAFDRIKLTDADYAPVGIPSDYDVVFCGPGKKGKNAYKTVPASKAGYENGDRAKRCQARRELTSLISRQRRIYYIMIAIVLMMFVIPLLWLPNPGAISEGWTTMIAGAFAWVISFVPLPKMAQVGQFWIQQSHWFLTLIGAYAAAFLWSNGLARAIQAKAQERWSHLAVKNTRNLSSQEAESCTKGDDRKAKAPVGQTVGVYKRLTKQLFPLLIVLLLFIVLPVIVAWRWYLFTPIEGQSVCAHVHAKAHPIGANALDKPFEVETANPCLNTGIELVQGREYTVTLTMDPKAGWRDGTEPNGGYPADPSGLAWSKMSWKSSLVMVSRSLSRRFWTEDWFALMGSIGRAREHAFRIDAMPRGEGSDVYAYTFYAWRSGRLYLFVNDAINPWKDDRFCSPGSFDATVPWRCNYDNNRGSAKVTVTEVAER